ncbi:MAG: AAA family ATPase [Alphaproteobacteria bacterium]|nr:AAA family ATPase [Alphaproteobacteria bacterium]
MTDGLERIRVAGLGSIQDATLSLGPITVLIGPNGSGKSNLLRALQMVPKMRTQSLQRFVSEAGGASALLHYGPAQTKELLLELDFRTGDNVNAYRARLGYAAGDRLLYLDENVEYLSPGHDQPYIVSLGAGHWESGLKEASKRDSTIKVANWQIARLNYFHFHDTSMTSALRTNARMSEDRYLRSDGSNLAAYLYRLEQSEELSDQKAWRRINAFVRRIAPAVKLLAPAVVGKHFVRLDWIDDRDERFGCHQLSDGTLRAIALITALSQPTQDLPGFISIDEPELGLHPSAIALIAGLARSTSHRCQVLMATQSTTLLDHFSVEEVVVVERIDGTSRFTRPDQEMLATWLDEYSLTEVFEKGIIGGRP